MKASSYQSLKGSGVHCFEILRSKVMRQFALYLLLSLTTASLDTGEETQQQDQDKEIEAAQQRVLSYVFCWALLVGVILISVAFTISSETQDATMTDLKESLLPSHFYPRKGDCYYSAPKKGDDEFINNL